MSKGKRYFKIINGKTKFRKLYCSESYAAELGWKPATEGDMKPEAKKEGDIHDMTQHTNKTENPLKGMKVAEIEAWAKGQNELGPLNDAIEKELTKSKGGLKAIQARFDELTEALKGDFGKLDNE